MKSLLLILGNRKYLAPALVFASLNVWFGTWAIYIPTVKEKLGIDKGDLGFALFFLSLGVFSVFPVASKLVNYFGVGRATWLGVLSSSIFALFPLLAPNYILLCTALFFFWCGQWVYRYCNEHFGYRSRKRRPSNHYVGSSWFF